MTTAKVDDKQRIRLPTHVVDGLHWKPGQVLAVQDNGDGSVTLCPVKPDTKEPFPRGSLLKAADEWNREMAPTAAKMKVPPPPKDWE